MRCWPVRSGGLLLNSVELPENTFYGPAAPAFPNKTSGKWEAFDRTKYQRSNTDRSIRCEVVRCAWPCDHHHHEDTVEPSLQVFHDTLNLNAEKGCRPCMLLREALFRRCHCMIQGSQPGLDPPHAFEQIRLFYHQQSDKEWNSVVTLSIATWLCGECELDLRLSGSMGTLLSPSPPKSIWFTD